MDAVRFRQFSRVMFFVGAIGFFSMYDMHHWLDRTKPPKED